MWWLSFGIVLVLTLASDGASDVSRPNIVLIVTDDQDIVLNGMVN